MADLLNASAVSSISDVISPLPKIFTGILFLLIRPLSYKISKSILCSPLLKPKSPLNREVSLKDLVNKIIFF